MKKVYKDWGGEYNPKVYPGMSWDKFEFMLKNYSWGAYLTDYLPSNPFMLKDLNPDDTSCDFCLFGRLNTKHQVKKQLEILVKLELIEIDHISKDGPVYKVIEFPLGDYGCHV